MKHWKENREKTKREPVKPQKGTAVGGGFASVSFYTGLASKQKSSNATQ